MELTDKKKALDKSYNEALEKLNEGYEIETETRYNAITQTNWIDYSQHTVSENVIITIKLRKDHDKGDSISPDQ